MANHLESKNVLLGVTGGIAAYRAAELIRRLRELGINVRVVMTPNATEFISALTLQALSGHAVRMELFDEAAEAGMSHIELARWADLILIAPATASFLARLAHGIADDLLSTVCLATSSEIAVAPAMNRLMWANLATQENVGILQNRKISILGPGVGSQACGEVGPGRMLDPHCIVEAVQSMFSSGTMLSGSKVLVTAGSTWEAIDPVRGISNTSSGKMGYAVADAASRAGAHVTLVSGLVSIPNQVATDQFFKVQSAQDMYEKVFSAIDGTDIFVSVAAVADYRPVRSKSSKMKKNAKKLQLELVRNPDILAEVKARFPHIYAVGFAAETENLVEQGRQKLVKKGVDLIAANLVGGKDGALGSDQNTLKVIDANSVETLGPGLKVNVARQLIEQIASRYHARRSL